MESNHDEVPVSKTNMPSDPHRSVCVEDQRQENHVGNHHDGAGQYHHQTNKHLPDKDKGDAHSEFSSEKKKLKTVQCD